MTTTTTSALAPGAPACVTTGGLNPMIETTGQLARITRSIIAGQPRAVDTVHVVAIEGDTLTYTADGLWYSTITRSALADWQLLGGDSGARLTPVRTYADITGRKHARIVDPNGGPNVLITRDSRGAWEAWRADSTKTLARGSFRQCVATARRVLNRT